MIENIYSYINKVAVYVSDRPEQTVSKITQLFHIMSYAQAEGFRIEAFFEDTESSAPRKISQGLENLIAYIQAQAPDWDYVIVYDRFSVPQDPDTYTGVVEFFESHGMMLISVKDGLGQDPDQWVDVSDMYVDQEGVDTQCR